MRIGIDVGGTNTDAVLMDGFDVLAEVKSATTKDVTSGILSALGVLLEARPDARGQIDAVMIGTTHFTNAVVEAKRLMPVAVIRIALPATLALPPMVDWPDRLKAAVGNNVYLCHGGFEVDGRPLAEFQPEEIRAAARDIRTKGITSVAIAAVFSPVRSDLEEAAAKIVAEEIPGAWVSLSHEIGRVGILERENATIMNASLRDLAIHITDAFHDSLRQAGIDAPVFISQNDGTLMTIERTSRYPVATFASGPTNSMRGAAFLSGEKDCAVVDIGGTTSDVGMLVNGFPREASAIVHIGDVRTNFRMPDVLPFGLGGGSIVRSADAQGSDLTIGPDSVGYELTEKALVFGGDTLTATDIAVAGGLARIGDPEKVAHLDPQLVERGKAWMVDKLAELVDRMKTGPDPIPVVIVGGGSILIADTLPGASRLVRPPHFGVANAIGAAIAQVSGEIDTVYSMQDHTRDQAVERAKREATERAIANGAKPETVEIVDIEEAGLSYMPGTVFRMKVKAIGDLDLGRIRNAADR